MKTIKIFGKRYSVDDPTDQASSALHLLKFVDQKTEHLNNMQALLMRARKGYISNLKKEILSKKTGMNFDFE